MNVRESYSQEREREAITRCGDGEGEGEEAPLQLCHLGGLKHGIFQNLYESVASVGD